MPPKKVPNMSYADVHAHWREFGYGPVGSYFPTFDRPVNDFSGAALGFIPSPGLVSLTVWIKEMEKKVEDLIAEMEAMPQPELDLNNPLTVISLLAWNAYNLKLQSMTHEINEIYLMLGDTRKVMFEQRDHEWDAHLLRNF